MKAKMRNGGCDVIKSIIFFSILLAGLVSAYTPEQQTIIEGMNFSFKLGIAHEKASQGQNVTEFNILVEIYNAWIRQHFGEDANLLMPKMRDARPLAVSSETNDTRSLPVTPGPLAAGQGLKAPFKPGSELSKFGKKQVYDFG